MPSHVLTILAVADVDRARQFYEMAFGWPLRVDVPVYAEFELPDGRGLGLYQREAFSRNTGAMPVGLTEDQISGTEIYLRCENLEAAIVTALTAGARLLAERAKRDWGDEAAYLADPDGNVLVLARPIPDPDIEEVLDDKGALCRRVLNALPDWFGIPEAVDDYVRDVEALPTFAALADGERVGFISLKIHTDYAAEVFVMGILPSQHRGGHGRGLIRAAEEYARRRGLRLLSVKTLSSAHESTEYAQTRRFYTAMGFVPTEEFPALWGEANPCLLMVKVL